MITLFVLDVPENHGVVDVVESDPTVSVSRCGPYFQVQAPMSIVIDRRATGCRHAVWYSSVAGLSNARIVRWDKDAMKIEQR